MEEEEEEAGEEPVARLLVEDSRLRRLLWSNQALEEIFDGSAGAPAHWFLGQLRGALKQLSQHWLESNGGAWLLAEDAAPE